VLTVRCVGRALCVTSCWHMHSLHKRTFRVLATLPRRAPMGGPYQAKSDYASLIQQKFVKPSRPTCEIKEMSAERQASKQTSRTSRTARARPKWRATLSCLLVSSLIMVLSRTLQKLLETRGGPPSEVTQAKKVRHLPEANAARFRLSSKI